MLKKIQSGFTLIELVLVIAVLGILAAIAVPKFIDLSGDAQTAATASTAGAASSASEINFGAFRVGHAGFTPMIGGTTTCDGVKALMQGSAWPTGYTASTTATLTTGVGATTACTLTGPNSTTATFTAITTQ